MAVKVSKLWSNALFTKLTNNSKLFYIYLCTSPDINSVGVCSLDINVISIQVSMGIDELREAMVELVDKGLILCDNISGVVYFTVLSHFNTLPKSDTSVMNVRRDLESLPTKLSDKLRSHGISTDRKAVKFKEPTLEEVADYAISKGYNIDAKAVVDYYRGQAKARGREGVWLDSRGSQIRDWRSKLRLVWFKDERKMKEVKGAPKGFEYFFINMEGIIVYPDSWKNNKPCSKSIAVDRKLKQEYERRISNI